MAFDRRPGLVGKAFCLMLGGRVGLDEAAQEEVANLEAEYAGGIFLALMTDVRCG